MTQKNENYTHDIELIGGIVTTDKSSKTQIGTTHKKVTFGKRLTAKDLIDLDNDPQSQNPTQYQDLVRRKMITGFGSLKMPVPLNLLLGLDSIDREDLEWAANDFLAKSRGDRTVEYLEDHQIKLPFGFMIDGTEYDLIKFGNRITGNDEVKADGYGNGIARRCFLMGRQISKISTSDGAVSIDGQVALETFHALDAESINHLWVGAELFRQSFRLQRKELS